MRTMIFSLFILGSVLAAATDSGTNQVLPAVPESYTLQGEGTLLNKTNLFFEPVHYRPIAAKVMGLKQNTISLNGAWRMDPKPGQNVREKPLNAASWGNFIVPGQWAQQGYDIPLDKTAALAREFSIPAKWAGYRIFLRFDAIHGGTHYWLNGKALGYSENLFTPVEWEITDAARPGQMNRLDLQMIVATASERLSYSSGYTQHSLGGIDRAVRIYALPKLQIASLHLNAGLDMAYRDGELQIDLGLDNPYPDAQNGLVASVQLFDASGRRVKHSNPNIVFDSVKQGPATMRIESQVTNPLKWNAERPSLYRLVIELAKDGKMLERIERHIGFRKIEIKGRQLYVNGARVKLAGVCHHEIDPLTGRADTMRHAEEDVKLIKSANLNDVRTSHYPPTQEFLDAADRYGLYIESEAPFCWVAPANDLTDLKAILTPTSAMIDYNHAHPSVIIWSLANESHWSGLFDNSDKLCKQLDPTRPTTFNLAFSNEGKVTCDIMNRHYQKMPDDEILKGDPRPFMHGECFYLVYHERTDVAIDPGLRELWAGGSAEPTSEWGKSCLENLNTPGDPYPRMYPGAWSYIYKSDRVIGSEIWAGVDDITFLPGGKVGSSESGNAYWGLIDSWRRPKPELYLSKFMFSPVWFPVRELDYKPGQASVRVLVENRYSFTDLSQFDFIWEINGAKGKARVSVPPASKGEIEIPIQKGTPEGTTLLVRVIKGSSEIVNATLSLGQRKPSPLPQPQAGAPKWNDDGRLITIEGQGFSLVLDRTTGDFDATNSKHKAPIVTFPSLHVTRHDYGDLNRKKPPYAEFPDAKTRVIESVTVVESDHGLEMTVKDHYEHFAGTIRWLIDKDGVGKISYDYTYTGNDLDSREIGVKALLPAEYDEVKWRRWSEWGNFPKDSISRTEGIAKARRNKKWPDQPANVKPNWPWSQDQTELGTADFRSIKFHIYEVSLVAPDSSGVRVDANADAHFRSCLTKGGVMMHILTQCPLIQVVLNTGDRLTGDFSVRLMAKVR
jgi:beta-galactosidase